MARALDKIKSIEELAEIAECARAMGKSVVLCHGVFDLVHLGHARHFEAARREGDLVLVTITADQFVNKGPDRPVFPEHQRAEMVAAFEAVDWVAINKAPTSEGVIEALKPNVYLKGSEYENPEDDLTGKIRDERIAVERHGGRLVFTNDVTFSSSSLMNKHLPIYDPELRDYFATVREGASLASLLTLLESVKDLKVLIVGDAIIDEYQYVEPLGKPSKENILATLAREREVFAGGVFAAANHVASFCNQIELITCLGEEDPYEKVIRDSLKPNVRLRALRAPGRPTTRKCRFVERGYLRKLFETYYMDDTPFPAARQRAIDDEIAKAAAGKDVVIVTDFGHGLIGRSTTEALTASAKFLAVNAQVNSGNHGYNLITKYPRADYICLDDPEARLAAGDKFGDIERIASDFLAPSLKCDRVIVTHGKYGCITYTKQDGVKRIPAFTKTVVDTVGAGDAFFAVTAPLASISERLDLVGFIGNAAGAMKVGIVGHRRSVEKVELMKYVTALLK